MRTLHKKLHLQHHSHTGRLIHHRHTSYRSLVVLFVVAGALMLELNYINRVAADELMGVTATVHVPRPQSAPIIASPLEGTTIKGDGTTVVGSCPIISPQAVVVISVDNAKVGSAACDSTNNFSFATNLSSGNHTIVATPYSVDNDAGPASTPLHLDVPNGTTATPDSKLTATTLFSSVTASKTVDWSGTLTGTKTPYRLLLNWGDGSYSSYNVTPGPQHLHHQYAQLASYNVTVGLRDGTGNYQYLQFAAANRDTSALAATTIDTSYNNASQTSTAIGLYGLFVTVVCVAAIVRLHAVPFAYADIRLGHHAKA